MYTLQGKPEQHAAYSSHSTPLTHDVRFLWAVPVRDNLSLTPTKFKHAPTPERSLDNQRLTDPTVVLDGLILPPMRQSWSRGERFLLNGYIATSAYWTHITSM
jgi:hypothetical protein